MPASILETAERLRTRRLSPVELTAACLKRIEQWDPLLNAFITVMAESALEAARKAEDEIQSGRWRGALHGIPLALKDLIDVAGVPTSAASAVLKGRIATHDADVTRRLLEAGAILLGKQNLHEFAYGGSSVISAYGAVHNPWNPDCMTGGSSGGSAAAVAAGLGLAAIGSDTAGSIREPAALCGVVGLKPTYGRVSAQGVIPLSLSLDHVGPLTTTVADAAIVLAAIEDPDAGEIGGVKPPPRQDYMRALEGKTKDLRIGVPRRFFFEELDPEVGDAMEAALRVLEGMTASLKEVSLPVSTDRTLQKAESYAYHREWVRYSPQLYDPETLRRIRTGESVEAEELARARNELEQMRREIGSVFVEVDLLVMPTTPIAAPPLAEVERDRGQLRPRELMLLRNTRPINVWGLPAISVPCGFTRAGLPIGLQLAAPHWGEARILRLARAYEQATEWHKRTPPL
ncbi:MAG TPA: amidase [Terriglobales bacterium]|nr:amidase [Terriglobales bacterium]